MQFPIQYHFKLTDNFIEKYKHVKAPFGFNGLGEFVYLRCVTVDTPVLCSNFVWKNAGDLVEGDKLIAFTEEPVTKNNERTMCLSEVTHNKIEDAECLGIKLENGEILYCTPEHRWLAKTAFGFKWVMTKDLKQGINGAKIYLPKIFDVSYKDNSYESGYLAAAFDGEGNLDKNCGLNFVQTDNEMLSKTKECLNKLKIDYTVNNKKSYISAISFKSGKPIFSIRIYGKENLVNFFTKIHPERLSNKYISNLENGKLTLRTPNHIQVVDVFDAGIKKIAVLSTSSKTHITAGYPSHNTYSRIKEDGKNEMWWETVRRVVEGIYSIQRQHIEDYNLGWNQSKAQKSAQEMYDRIFNFKMLPAGRSLWSMGADVIMNKGLTSSLYNCSFLSTENIHEEFGKPFANAMDFLMCGVGVGADVKGAGKIKVKKPNEKITLYQIPDTREGWCESLRMLINSYSNNNYVEFDYSLIRAEGEPIKTFGGIASGAKPLIELHDTVRKILDKRVDEYITITDITDIFNLVGKAVIAGNVRRSAEIIIGEPTDEFLNLKNYEINPEREEHGWASNNTIYASLGMNYKDISDRILTNGEPGLVWIDNCKKYGRMRESESNYKDIRVSGLNPCFSYESKLLINTGYIEIGSLDGKTVGIVDSNGIIQQGKVFKSGNKDTIKLRLSNNQIIICTPDHILKTIDGQNEAKNCKGKQLYPFLNYKKLNDHYVLLGFAQGDGDLGRLKSDSHKGIEINIGKNDKDILLLLSDHKYTLGTRKVYIQDIKEELVDLGFDSKTLPFREFPLTYDSWTLENKASFLRGCFSANGCINNHGRITYKSTSRSFIDKLRKTLEEEFDIYSYITTNKTKEIRFSNGLYTVKESYDLNISQFESKIKFNNEINFYQSYKIEKLANLLLEMSPFVTSIKNNGLMDVYDFSIGEPHLGVINGFVVHNCGEITLESQELCNLAETFPNNHESLEDYKTTVKYAYLYAKSVTLLNTQWSDTNRVMLRNRRIGLSMTGLAQFISKVGISVAKDWMEESYVAAKKYDKIYSEWFAIPESIKMTTVKPSGTLSLLAGATSGMHYPESQHYIRRVRLAKNSQFVESLSNAGYNIEPAVGQEKSTVVVEFPVSVGDNVRTIKNVSMWEQLNLASFLQENWADNSVSVTVTFDPKTEGSDIENALNLFQFKLKAVSFLPRLEEGAYKQMPYEEITKEEYDKMVDELLPLDFSNLFSQEADVEKYCSNDGCTVL